MSALAEDIQEHWTAIRPVLCIRTERDYSRAVDLLNGLLDEVGTNERHPLYELLDTLGTLVRAYEEARHPIPDCSGPDALRFLMDENGLTQSDLPEIGSQGVVSEVLSGKRTLNTRHVRDLAKRFGVSPAVFI